MGTTTTYLLPYPELDEPDDVPADVKELAERLELVLPTFQEVVEYGQPNGYAPLGPDGKVPAAYLPAVTPPTTFTVLSKTTRKDVASSTTKTDLFNGEIVFPANSLKLGGRAYGFTSGDFLNNSGGTRAENLTVDMGGVEVWDGGTFDVTVGSVRRNWRMTFEVRLLDAANATFTAFFVMGAPSAASAGNGTLGGTSTGSSACIQGPVSQNTFPLNPAIANTFALNIKHPTSSASLSMRMDSVRVEIV